MRAYISLFVYVCVCVLECVIVATKDFLILTQLQLSFDPVKPQKERDDRPGALKAFKCCLCYLC